MLTLFCTWILVQVELDLSSSRLRGDAHVVGFSPVDSQIAFGDGEGDIDLWNCQTGTTEGTLSSPRSPVAAMTFSRCGRYLASISDYYIVRLWDRHASVILDLFGEKQVASVPGADGDIFSTAFSTCGNWMASTSMNKRVRLWRRQDPDDLESRFYVTEVRGFTSGVTRVAWNPVIPMEFVTRCNDGSVQVWQIVTGEDRSVSVGLVWPTDLNQLSVSGLAFKDAIGLGPVYQKLLIQRGTDWRVELGSSH